MINNDLHLDLLRRLELNPKYTQRELSQELGVSLGKINYCLKKLSEKGLVKMRRFQKSDNKRAYAYLLTLEGIDQKGKLTIDFLQSKVQEYEILEREILLLKEEIEGQ